MITDVLCLTRCPSTDKWKKKACSVYTMDYYAAVQKDGYPTFASIWMGLEEIMLNEAKPTF